MNAFGYLLIAVAWVGHAAVWTALLSNLYGRALPKAFLKMWRVVTGLVILAFPFPYLIWPIDWIVWTEDGALPLGNLWSMIAGQYLLLCMVFTVEFIRITIVRHRRQMPTALLSEKSTAYNFRPALGAACRGDGKHRYLAYLPFNGIFRLDVTELTLRLPRLPPKLDGLSVLVLSDLHLHGTPSRAWFDAAFDELAKLPTPDVIALVGDYVDTVTHHEWLAPLLGKLKWTEVGLAILGNHDLHHHPEKVRAELANLGYTVLGNHWHEVTIRGERVVVIGHEGPWFRPPPGLSGMPGGVFRLCLSHSPDQFPWAARNGVDLTLSGHTHGGAIRVPVVGSIFVPCTTGRRYDAGVFEKGGSVLVVGRGLSGKEPIRFRCNPQVLRLVLKRSG